MAELSNLRRSRDDQEGLLPRRAADAGDPGERTGPAERTTVVLPPIVHERFPAGATGILIKAQPARDGRSCKLMLNREVLAGYSWRFDSRARAQRSALAGAIFASEPVAALGKVSAVNLHGAIVSVELDEPRDDWRPLAVAIGAIVRAQLASGDPVIDPALLADMPSEAALRAAVERVLAEEINPGVAGHGGAVSLVEIQGNTLYMHMGGGCQGCAAAGDTLQFGIDDALRRVEPKIGLVLDATDHAAGQNPYYSGAPGSGT